jgi:NAD-dependent dihydropyrimidine dehydrogenase PreA subunit/flavodoxin
MIFYFTGTGNSLYAANYIAENQGDRLYSIARLMGLDQDAYRFEMAENEILGFVFPVFAWGPPKIVLDFISRLEIVGAPYVFSLSTCGDEEGGTPKIMEKALAARGLKMDSAFSLRMPNNYIIGFEVDAKEVETEKLRAAGLMLDEICKVIGKRQKDVRLTIPGRFPALKSALVNGMFNRFAINTKRFSAEDTCTRCGICETVCPVHTIRLDENKPVWGKNCTQCLACINRCPVHAIQYGKSTVHRGRYHHPDIAHLEKKDHAEIEQE